MYDTKNVNNVECKIKIVTYEEKRTYICFLFLNYLVVFFSLPIRLWMAGSIRRKNGTTVVILFSTTSSKVLFALNDNCNDLLSHPKTKPSLLTTTIIVLGLISNLINQLYVPICFMSDNSIFRILS